MGVCVRCVHVYMCVCVCVCVCVCACMHICTHFLHSSKLLPQEADSSLDVFFCVTLQKRQQIQDMLAKHKELTKKLEAPSSSESEDDSDSAVEDIDADITKNAWMKPSAPKFAPTSAPAAEPSAHSAMEDSDGEEEDIMASQKEEDTDDSDGEEQEQETRLSTPAEEEQEDSVTGRKKRNQNTKNTKEDENNEVSSASESNMKNVKEDEKDEEGLANESGQSSEGETPVTVATEDSVGGKKKRKRNKKGNEKEGEGSESKGDLLSNKKILMVVAREDNTRGKMKKKQNRREEKDGKKGEESHVSSDTLCSQEKAPTADPTSGSVKGKGQLKRRGKKQEESSTSCITQTPEGKTLTAASAEDCAGESSMETEGVEFPEMKEEKKGKQREAISSEEKTLMAVVKGLRASENDDIKSVTKKDKKPSDQPTAVAAEAKTSGQTKEDVLMTIAEAFDDDDVVAEFVAEKQHVEEKEQEKDVDLFVPGWGSWAGAGIVPSKQQKKR